MPASSLLPNPEEVLDQAALIDSPEALSAFLVENQGMEWMGFDTEFVGEKRYKALLCLIQVSTAKGYYFLDAIALQNHLQPFADLLGNPDILKITHAGENDYRIMYQQYGVIPRNLFDVQMAAGFLGYKYPLSFQKLVEKEAKVSLSKGYTVSDWESRPLNRKQMRYALEDILYLRPLQLSLTKKLTKLGRLSWAMEEMTRWEDLAFYTPDPFREALSNSMIQHLNVQEQIFLVRLYEWRRNMAERRNHSKEMVLPAKYISNIVQSIRQGREALKDHRRIPNHIIDQYWDIFRELYNRKVTDEERRLLSRIPESSTEPSHDTLMIDILYLLIKSYCTEHKMAHDLALPPGTLRTMKYDLEFWDDQAFSGWRQEFLGEDILKWLHHRAYLHVDLQDGQWKMYIKA